MWKYTSRCTVCIIGSLCDHYSAHTYVFDLPTMQVRGPVLGSCGIRAVRESTARASVFCLGPGVIFPATHSSLLGTGTGGAPPSCVLKHKSHRCDCLHHPHPLFARPSTTMSATAAPTVTVAAVEDLLLTSALAPTQVVRPHASGVLCGTRRLPLAASRTSSVRMFACLEPFVEGRQVPTLRCV